MYQMLTFCNIHITILSIVILLIFAQWFESRLQTSWTFTPKYISMYFLKTKMFSYLLDIV